MIQTDRGHFWLTFENGYTISVFNGYGSYSENHFDINILKDMTPVKSNSCEVAIIYEPSREFATRNFIECDNDVKCYVNVDELVEIINKVKNCKGEKQQNEKICWEEILNNKENKND